MLNQLHPKSFVRLLNYKNMKKIKITQITKAQDMIDIIKPISDKKFCENTYINDSGQCCFLGHIHTHINGEALGDLEGYGARELTRKFIDEIHGINADGADVNNGPLINGYKEKNPKKRIMHLLTDMLEAGY